MLTWPLSDTTPWDLLDTGLPAPADATVRLVSGSAGGGGTAAGSVLRTRTATGATTGGGGTASGGTTRTRTVSGATTGGGTATGTSLHTTLTTGTATGGGTATGTAGPPPVELTGTAGGDGTATGRAATMRNIFTTPTYQYRYESAPHHDRGTQTVGRWFSQHNTGLAVLLIDGQWVERRFPTPQEVDQAQVHYRGGRRYTLTSDAAADLVAAGYDVALEEA